MVHILKDKEALEVQILREHNPDRPQNLTKNRIQTNEGAYARLTHSFQDRKMSVIEIFLNSWRGVYFIAWS